MTAEPKKPGTLTYFLTEKIGKRPYLLTAAIYAASLVLIFMRYLPEPGSLYCRVVRDFWPIYNSLPQFYRGARFFHFGYFPLWNFMNGFGTPFLGDLQSAPFHPARLLFLLPFWKVIDVWLLARVFISGMLTYGLCRRRGASWHGATIAGLAWMLTGSVTDYINMHYLDIDLLLPAGVLVFGSMARRGGFASVIGTAIVVTIAFLGGNPTSMLYFLIFCTLYYFYTVYRLREDVSGAWIRFFAAAALSGFAAAIVLLPFREFLANAWDYHPAGVGALAVSPRNLLTLLGPEVYGPEVENGIPLVQRLPYMGVIPVMLALSAILCLRRMSSGSAFFAGFAAIFGGLVIGAMPFRLIGFLPLFIRTSNFRYALPEVAFCIAVLAGNGLDHLTRWRETAWRILLAPSALTLISAWLVAEKHLRAPIIPIKGEGLLVLVALAWATAIALLLHRRKLLNTSVVTFLLIAMWVMEAGLHVHNQKPLAQLNPQKLAALPEGVELRTLLEGRIYATPGILYPNMNMLNSIMDVRYLDALYVERYARFMRLVNGYSEDELLANFQPYNYFDIAPDRLESPLTDLMGLTTILSDVALPPNRLVPEIYREGSVRAPAANYVSVKHVTINDDRRVSLFEHPPVRIKTAAPPGYIMFGIGIDPSRWDKEGDGVTFSIYQETRDHLKCIFTRHLDPYHIPADRSWSDYIVAHGGGDLILETTPGADNRNDWAVWGDIHSSYEEISRFDLIDDVPLKVYVNSASLLGAFVVGNVRVVASMEEAAEALKQGMDFRTTAVVEGSDAQSLRANIKPQDDYNINLTRYFGDRVRVRAMLKNTGVVVLTDAYYPGWRAYVDGAETKIFPADLAFRAVKCPAGEHRLEFIYKPSSFRIGLWVSLCTWIILLYMVYNSIGGKKPAQE